MAFKVAQMEAELTRKKEEAAFAQQRRKTRILSKAASLVLSEHPGAQSGRSDTD